MGNRFPFPIRKDSASNLVLYKKTLANYQIMEEANKVATKLDVQIEWDGNVMTSRGDSEYTSETVDDRCPWVFKFCAFF